ncbi:hypothetical protein EJ04DRAFT_496567 [Polyplosphaeria fusca]|uniref:Rhodopsin domain-containing protein n=1 Tax=Polyplosphaeria fusca TaxID=682080 RepID=A0A9P4QX35_9PLEO|nr:hypothetical protein EJ04DRAFT_496567 [Polyplosphaeria fusca]
MTAPGAAPPDPDSNVSGTYVVPVTVLAVLTIGLVVLRIWTRVTRTRSMYVDDWLIGAAELLSLTNISLSYAAVSRGWGKPIATLTPADLTQNLKLQFAVQTTWILTLCLVRISVATSLLRFFPSLLWRLPLYTIIVLQSLISASYIVIQFAQCSPVSAAWEHVPDVKCWPVQPIINYGWAIAGVYVAIDLTLALMPIKLMRALHRPMSEKFLIGILMATGLLATTMACAKMTTFTSFGKGDPMQDSIMPSLWAKLEEQVGIIAACLPALKAPVERGLRRAGVLETRWRDERPSFVKSGVSLGVTGVGSETVVGVEGEEEGEEEGERKGKGGVRVDSVAVAPGSAGVV